MKNPSNLIKTSIFILAAVYIPAISQISQVWTARYNGTQQYSDEASSIAVDASGSVYVTGYSYSAGNPDYVTIKYSSSGDSIWVRKYNGTGNFIDEAKDIAVDGVGNVYVTGRSTGAGTGDDYATIKYNSSGVQLWAARYNGPGNGLDWASAIAIDQFGNVYVTGQSAGTALTSLDYLTIKYNSSGDSLWVARYNGLANGVVDRANDIMIDNFGNVYVTGASSGGASGYDYATIKYNSAGVQQWAARYNGSGNSTDEAYSLFVDGARNVYVTGGSTGTASANFNYLTIKYDSTGNAFFAASYNGPAGNNSDIAYSLDVDVSGNVYVTGSSFGIGSAQDYATVKYSPLGAQQWVKRYNGPANTSDGAKSLKVDGAGNVYVTGASIGNGSSQDYCTIKYSSAGDSLWGIRYNGIANGPDAAAALTLDAMGNVYVTGSSEGQYNDYLTIKYSQLVGIQIAPSEIPDKFALYQNYPNPFNPVCRIKYSLAEKSDVILQVFDILGREVKTIVSKVQNPGSYEVEFDGSNLSSGVYFYKISAGSFTDTKKMILVK